MPLSLFKNMQKAVDIVNDSPHPTNKIAACLAGRDIDGQDFSVAYTNYWPDVIQEYFGSKTKIGNASGTLHAETACLIHAPRTEGAVMFVTDPPCPNCMKYMAEAGVQALYIDHKGFHKDFAVRRGHHFENMSMKICELAGINVYEIWRKEQKIVPIFERPEGYKPEIENPVVVENVPTALSSCFLNYVRSKEEEMGVEPFSVALGKDGQGNAFFIAAQVHPVIGYTPEMIEEEYPPPPNPLPEGRGGTLKANKYSFLVQPITRVMMTAARHGLKIDKDFVFSSVVPTSRQLVNMIGAGLNQVYIGDETKSRDEFGLVALGQLRDAGVLKVLESEVGNT